jgi:hypothetical protein
MTYRLKVEAKGKGLNECLQLWENENSDLGEAIYEAMTIAEERMQTLGATDENIHKAMESLQEYRIAEWCKGKKSVVASVWEE